MDAPTELGAALAGLYEIEREIGRGGMATVYLARDVKHARNVALKVLNPELGAVLGVERFLSEIRVTANLQHPNLLPLFDSGEANGLLFYVMPYLDGESLRHRIDREKQLPVDEAIQIAVAVANALAYAHQHGVIHRDLKPENILLQHGQPVVADFGIALAVSNAGGARVTQTGLSLGTPQYMSPEQATGDREIDARADIYSLAAVTYEMLAGEPPHTGTTAQAIVAKLLTEEPRPLTVLRRAVSDALDAAVQRALEKPPADRWASAAQFADALQAKSVVARRPRSAPSRSALVLPIAASLVIAAVGIAAWTESRAARSALPIRPIRFELAAPPRVPRLKDSETRSAIVPDGSALIVRGRGPKGAMLYRRRLDEAAFIPVAGGEGAEVFAVSPDGNWIAFGADSQLKKIPIQGGAPTTILALSGGVPAGLSWGRDLIALGFTPGVWSLSAVNAAGGVRRAVSSPDTARRRSHRWPRILADGETVLFTDFPPAGVDSSRIGITSLVTGETTLLDLLGAYPLGVMEGRVVYVRADGAIMAAPIDVKRRRITGEPIVIEQGVGIRPGTGAPEADLSPSGMLIFAGGDDDRRLTLVDRVTGTGRPLTEKPDIYGAPRYSPDGKKLAFIRGPWPKTELWVHDLAANTQIRLVEGVPFWNLHPAWSPDGKRIAFTSGRKGTDATVVATGAAAEALWWQVADGSAGPEPLASSRESLNEVAFTPDGNTIVFRQGSAPHSLAYRAVRGDTTIIPLVTSPYLKYHPTISPDGKWLAYTSYETGEPRVYVRAFPAPASKWPVSDGAGMEPRWAPDGHAIYYRTRDKMMTAHVTMAPTFTVTSRDTLFADRFVRSFNHRGFDISPDGKTFVMISSIAADSALTVIVNWRTTLRARLPAK